MLIGFLKAVLVFILPVVLLNLLPDLLGAPLAVKRVAVIAAYSIFIIFIPFAMVGARRYRLSRASWRGIRFSFRGKAWDFVKLFIRGSFLTALSLGLYYPIFDTQKYEFIVSNSYFGNRQFHFAGKGRELFRPYLLALLLTIPTVGFYWFWYLAKKKRFIWQHTSFGSVRFSSTVTGRCLMNLYVGNFLLLIITLGLGWPWVVVRKTEIIFKYLTLNGQLDLAEVQQEAQGASATGEALAGFLDAGFDLG
jgi:uncharacterized membrane protein YjgN (DUF898 family)